VVVLCVEFDYQGRRQDVFLWKIQTKKGESVD